MESQLLFRIIPAVLLISTIAAVVSPQLSNLSPEDGNYFFYQQNEYPKDCRDVQRQCPSSNSSGVYIIKPEGFQEPFEVYCDNHIGNGGWTVIQRREHDQLILTNRSWAEYKDGFGFLSSDFWLGNEKLAFLTNQKVYELRIDVEMSSGASFYSTYNGFRIADEFGEYMLQHITSLGSNGSSLISYCPPNMQYGPCTCQKSCEDPKGASGCQNECSSSESCICPEGYLMNGTDCIPINECVCFISEANFVLSDGETYVNGDCSRRCSCIGNELICDDDFNCDENAECGVSNGVRLCNCNDGFEGDGQTCEASFSDCQDVYDANYRHDGVYTILPTGWIERPFRVYCELGTEGGWTVIQRRVDDSTSFYQNWTSYKNGFGELNRNIWLGNEKLYYLTNQKNYKLRFEMTTSSGSPLQADFSEFQIESESANYRMNNLGTRTGGAAANLLHHNRGRAFSTYDRDNDGCSLNCAEKHRSGWWHTNIWCNNCYRGCDCFHKSGSCHTGCTEENPNGDYNGGDGENIFSGSTRFCNIRSTELKILPSS